MDYILSTDGQQVVSDDGYIAIKDTKAYEGNCSGEKGCGSRNLPL